jgi:hypothetical protein
MQNWVFQKLKIMKKASFLYLTALAIIAFYSAPFISYSSSKVLDWAFAAEGSYADPFLRGKGGEFAAPPIQSNVPATIGAPSINLQMFGPLESNKSFSVKERSYGTLWIIAKNSAAHQFTCSLESPTPKGIKITLSTFEQGCEIQYNIGKPTQKTFPLDILVQNMSGIRLLSENKVMVVPRATKTY